MKYVGQILKQIMAFVLISQQNTEIDFTYNSFSLEKVAYYTNIVTKVESLLTVFTMICIALYKHMLAIMHVETIYPEDNDM